MVCKSGILPYSCSICHKQFAAANSLANHVPVHEENTTTIPCKKCGRKFRKIGSHAKHEEHCNEDPCFACNHCEASFPSQEQLKRHSKNHLNEVLHCELCNKTFTHSNGFAQHKKSHAEERFKCTDEECDQEFKTFHNLKKHCKLHEQPRRLDCQICGKKFGGAWNLKRHLLTHSGLKPFKCEGCAKRFTCEKDMQAHAVIHTGRKGFNCTHCPSSFTHLRGLQQHQNIHSDKASTCGKGCGR